MIEFEKWFFVMLANFLVLIFLLRKLLFLPLLNIIKERKRITSDCLLQASVCSQEREKASVDIKFSLARANEKAAQILNNYRTEGQAAQKAAIQKAQDEALAMIESAAKEIAQKTSLAKENLNKDVPLFAKEIVTRII